MRYQRLFQLLFVLALSFTLFVSPIAYADALSAEEDLAKAYILMEKTSGQILIEKDSDTTYSIAGLTRLPALLLICEAIDRGELKAEDTMVVSESAAAVPGPTAFVETGETISVESLLKSAVMISAGDAIMTLGEHLYGTEQEFVNEMNTRLEQLGIDAEYESLTTVQAKLSAKDLAIIGSKLADSKCFTRYSNLYLDELIHEGGRRTELVNPNKLIRENTGCYGLSTGSSSESGYCGVFSFNRSGEDLICVVLGAKNSRERFEATLNLVEYGYTNFRSVRLAGAGEVMKTAVPVERGNLDHVDLIAERELVLMLPKDSGDPLISSNIPESLQAPFSAGDIVGHLNYTDKDGDLLATLDLVAATGVSFADYPEYFRDIILLWLRS